MVCKEISPTLNPRTADREKVCLTVKAMLDFKTSHTQLELFP